MGDRRCSVPGCLAVHDSAGYCGMHYMRWKRYGDALRSPLTPSERFWAKVVEDGDCWVWTGSGQVYGKVGIGGFHYPAHRFAYEDMVAEIPARLTLDHLCLNKRCVNPAHLEPVPHRENNRRADVVYGIRSAVTHCPQGHEYTAANTAHRNGRRHCRACDRARAARNREQRKVAS